NGLTFLEFNYMLMQAFDFYSLYQKYGCNMQFGGDDQWSNMLAGTELIRRKLGKDCYALTITLLTNSEGKKMGKTANGAVWLDPNKTKPYDFYQYWRNVSDDDVIKCIKLLTFLPLSEIKDMESWKDEKLNEAKSILAYELTKLVHGEEEAKKCDATSKAIFSGKMDIENMPSVSVSDSDFVDDKIELSSLLVLSKLCTSKGDARRTIEQGGVTVDDEKIVDVKSTIDKDKIKDKGVVLKKGKKSFIRVILSCIVCSFFV
ncbi:MAG: tyrosine--tRNA ligase, partial [Lachnospiraceae bacterium]|nr:tyrosine--tRNA ligase [Lachnospiraceae bacterium]